MSRPTLNITTNTVATANAETIHSGTRPGIGQYSQIRSRSALAALSDRDRSLMASTRIDTHVDSPYL